MDSLFKVAAALDVASCGEAHWGLIFKAAAPPSRATIQLCPTLGVSQALLGPG